MRKKMESQPEDVGKASRTMVQVYPLRKKGTRRKQQIDCGAVLRKFYQNPQEPKSLSEELPIPHVWCCLNITAICCHFLGAIRVRCGLCAIYSVTTKAGDFDQLCSMQSVIHEVIQNFHGSYSLYALRYIPGASSALFTNAENFIFQNPLRATFWHFLPMVVSHRRPESGKKRKATGFLALFLCFWRVSPALIVPPPGLQLLWKALFPINSSFH